MDETVKLDARGRLVFPAGWLERWGVKPGDAMTLRLESGSLRVTPRRLVISSFVGRFALSVPASGSNVTGETTSSSKNVPTGETTPSSVHVPDLETTGPERTVTAPESTREGVNHGA
jgi:bifunctional DNA-binding transcriptional regulator/antitoxin component of YhaV-PrlF toxin-antitoxin module